MPGPASPTAPFAPPVRLGALLAREELGLRLVAGDPETELHWVHTSEMADPFPYLLGGELLLTAGVQLARTDPGRFAARVAEAGAAALGFGVTPVYDTVPEPLAEACVRHGLPLLEVPPRTPFSAVARAVWALMSEARHQGLRRATDAQRALATAAARPDPVPAVLHALAGHLSGRAALYAPDGTEYAADGRGLTPEEGAALERLVRLVAGTGRRPSSAADTGPGGVRLAAYSLGTGAPGLTLGLAMARREESDQRIAETAMVLLSLLTAPHQAADEATRSAALVRLLLGAGPSDVAPLLGEAPWTVVHARGPGAAPGTASQAPPPALGSPLVDVREDGTVRVLLPAAREVGPHPGWTLGVSAPAAPGDLRAADAQAARALRRAEAARAPLSRHHPSGFAALVDEGEAAAHAGALLAPLSGAPALAETLHAWLSLHGSWDRTAAALGVHRNTVRQRIARCAALLDADLDDVEVRMELWFALRWR
ncbi:PucR family transcriptional regulator [Streptomyces sp. MUM 203J]|uniref:PucR family transcriptional regulator n=1 Tax=Streptomyces sp. MUM 203J TaxID=2791990 RepID=UPI001F03983C|nr:PucR family transcriptional regulator [Streptomyces sp. MUM 203J]MCH0540261.1 PucR family transcriptional regulator [Streptomyces sp. MUM 203J]